MNSQDEQRVNIKFCILLCKSVMETIKLLREVCCPECMTESPIHERQFLILKNPEWSTTMWEKKVVDHGNKH